MLRSMAWDDDTGRVRRHKCEKAAQRELDQRPEWRAASIQPRAMKDVASRSMLGMLSKRRRPRLEIAIKQKRLDFSGRQQRNQPKLLFSFKSKPTHGQRESFCVGHSQDGTQPHPAPARSVPISDIEAPDTAVEKTNGPRNKVAFDGPMPGLHP